MDMSDGWRHFDLCVRSICVPYQCRKEGKIRKQLARPHVFAMRIPSCRLYHTRNPLTNALCTPVSLTHSLAHSRMCTPTPSQTPSHYHKHIQVHSIEGTQILSLFSQPAEPPLSSIPSSGSASPRSTTDLTNVHNSA